MRVKVGDQWFQSAPDQPIMVEFSEGDKANLGITRMAANATRYADFHALYEKTEAERGAWMDEGARKPGRDLRRC